MDPRRLRVGEVVAALGGIALFGVMFLSWYELARAGGADESVTAWEAFTIIDIVLLVTAVAALALALGTMTYRQSAVPIALAVLTFALGVVALILVVIRVIDAPADGLSADLGLWLGLAAVLAIAIGGWVALRDEHEEPDERTEDIPVRPAPPARGAEPGSSGA